MTTLYVNTITGTIDEVDGDSFLVNLDLLTVEQVDTVEDLDADELVAYLQSQGSEAIEEIAR